MASDGFVLRLLSGKAGDLTDKQRNHPRASILKFAIQKGIIKIDA